MCFSILSLKCPTSIRRKSLKSPTYISLKSNHRFLSCRPSIALTYSKGYGIKKRPFGKSVCIREADMKDKQPLNFISCPSGVYPDFFVQGAGTYVVCAPCII